MNGREDLANKKGINTGFLKVDSNDRIEALSPMAHFYHEQVGEIRPFIYLFFYQKLEDTNPFR